MWNQAKAVLNCSYSKPVKKQPEHKDEHQLPSNRFCRHTFYTMQSRQAYSWGEGRSDD